MMNVLSLCILLASLVSGSLWSPSVPPRNHDHQEVIVKEGHRVVVVEYEKEADGNIKVLISPQDPSGVDAANEKPLVDDSASSEGMLTGPRELVCDAYGKCKHKIANALGRTKDKADVTSEMKEHAKTSVGGPVGKAKDAVYGHEDCAKEAVSGALGKAKELGKEDVEKIKLMKKATEKATGHTIGDSLGKAKKVAGDMVGTIKDAGVKTANFDVVDSPKRMGEDIERNITARAEEGAERVMEHAKETIEHVKQVGRKSLGEIVSKLREVGYDVIWYVVYSEKVEAVVSLIHVLGVSTAYGMCVWVTFVSSYILGRYLPRQQFGMLQSKIYPVYFRGMAYCIGAALLGHLMSRREEIWFSMMETFQVSTLLSALLMVFTNMICLEPRATKLMSDRMKTEKEEGRGGTADGGSDPMARPPGNVVAERERQRRMNNEKLKMLNAYSSALNVLTLVVLTWHLAYVGQRLQAMP